METKKGLLGKVLTFIGVLVAIGGAALAIVHFWDDIKEKLGIGKDEIDELEDFAEEAGDALEDATADIRDEMEDFVEFEEI